MALSPIAFIAPNYRDFKTYWLKAYEQGTTTPKSMALDADGLVTVAKLELNADGFLESAGGALVIPYIDGAYDAWLFRTEALADANDTTNAEQVADNITGVNGSLTFNTVVINFDILDNAVISTNEKLIFDGSALNIKERTAGNGGGAMWDVVLASSVTPDTYTIVQCTGIPTLALVLRISDKGFDISEVGALGDGSDDSGAFTAANNAFPTLDGFDVQLGAKTYNVDSAALYITRKIRFIGHPRGSFLDFSSSTTVVNAPYNCHAIVVHSNNITGSSSFSNPITLPVGQVGTNGSGGGFKGLEIICNSSVTDGIGLFINVSADVSRVRVTNAELHCMVIAGNSSRLESDGVGPTGLDIGGNSNNGLYSHIRGSGAVRGVGILFSGSDANANTILHPDCSSNGDWGIYDDSLLGNTWVGPHTAGNSTGAIKTRPSSTQRSLFVSPYAESGQGITPYDVNVRSMIIGAEGDLPKDQPAIIGSNDGISMLRKILVSAEPSRTADYTQINMGEIRLATTDGDVFQLIRNGSSYTNIEYDGNNMIQFRNTGAGADGMIDSTAPFFPGGLTLDSDVKLSGGAGDPEGSLVGRPGSIFMRNDGGAGTTFYVKESGNGNTGWVGK